MQDHNTCFRCDKMGEITPPTESCDVCLKRFCKKCSKLHEKYNECFRDTKWFGKGYICGEGGFYDWSIGKEVLLGTLLILKNNSSSEKDFLNKKILVKAFG